MLFEENGSAFHSEISSIDQIMGGSGLQDLLETFYSPNAVVHMLTDNAVSRAVKGHFLTDSAFHILLLENTV